MHKPSKRTYVLLTSIVLIFVIWGIFSRYVPPDVLVDKIGIKNVYLGAFILASVGGFSSITGTSVYTAIVAIANDNVVNTIILGIMSGLGIFLSDSLFFLLASYGRNMIVKVASNWERTFTKVSRWVRAAPDWSVYAVVFLYSAFAPLPNDILLGTLAVTGYSYKQFALYLFIGDLTAMLLLTQIADRVS